MKDITECHARLRGLFNITVTPFKADGAFDHAGLARNIERVIGLGFDGILIGGTYGEFPAMSTEERADLFRREVRDADHLPAEKLLLRVELRDLRARALDADLPQVHAQTAPCHARCEWTGPLSSGRARQSMPTRRSGRVRHAGADPFGERVEIVAGSLTGPGERDQLPRAGMRGTGATSQGAGSSQVDSLCGDHQLSRMSSTVLDCTGGSPAVVRVGAITESAVAEALSER